MDLSNTKLADLGTMSGTGPAPQSMAEMPAGKVLADRYEIIGVIGRGGMGVVYEAADRLRGTSVALKFLLPELVASDIATQRFLNEARVASDLAHEGVVRVYDVAKYENTYFLSMELLPGKSLRQLLQELKASDQKMPVAQALGITRDMAQALAYAHRTTIHRDIKPENIWILPDGKAKLMDFGIARLQSQTQGLTKTSAALGTAYYMAPEQLVGSAQIDHRADQYSLGVVLYEMLTGTLPMGRSGAASTKRVDLHKKVDAVVDRMLAGRPEERFSDDSALLTAVCTLPVAQNTSGRTRQLAWISTALLVLVFVVLVGNGWYIQRQKAAEEQLSRKRAEEFARTELLAVEAQRKAAETETTRKAAEAEATRKAADSTAIAAHGAAERKTLTEEAPKKNADPVDLSARKVLTGSMARAVQGSWGSISNLRIRCSSDSSGGLDITVSADLSMPANAHFGFGITPHALNGGWGSFVDGNRSCGPFVSEGWACKNSSGVELAGSVQLTAHISQGGLGSDGNGNTYKFLTAQPFIMWLDKFSGNGDKKIASGMRLICRG